ncbi:MAG: recombinase family protein, partial [Ruminococcus sp.]|nr:recombinase family protein [Ruminococcus sp.]
DKVRLDHGKGYSLVPNDDAQYVQMIFDWYLNDNASVYTIADRLTDIGATPAKGGDYFSPHSIRDILRNQVYIGKVTWNWRVCQKSVVNGEVKVSRPKNEPDKMIVCEGKHQAIISDELFWAVQEKIGSNSRQRREYELVNPFAGLIKCSECGHALIYRRYPKSKDALVCPNKYCSVSSIAYYIAEEAILQQLEGELGRLKVSEQSITMQETGLAREEKRLKKELSTLQQQMNKLYDLLEQGIYTPEVFAERKQILFENKRSTERELSKIQNRKTPTKIMQTVKTVEDLLTNYADMTPAERNVLLKQCIAQISYYRERSSRYDQKPAVIKVDLKF